MYRNRFVQALLLLLTLLFCLGAAPYSDEEWEILSARPVDAPQTEKSGTKIVALTFDDGPLRTTTPSLLRYLREQKVKATFFIIGRNAVGNQSILQQMAKDGHQVGNHTYAHPALIDLSDAGIRNELRQTTELIQKNTLAHPTTMMMRPTKGLIDDRVRSVANMPCIMWSIDPMDWLHRDASYVADHVISRAADGDIILLHDVHATTVDAMRTIVPALKQKGFTFVTVEELILIKQQRIRNKVYRNVK